MAGTTRRHNLMVQNLIVALRSLARKNGCQTFAESVKQELRSDRRYVYPDVVYTCHPEDIRADENTWARHPSLLIEVLPESTQGVDRSRKRQAYFRLPSLQAYLLLDQDRCFAELYQRAHDFWRFEFFTELTDRVRIDTLGIELSLCEVYEGISFPPPDEEALF
jgi:Uma2 family endonuclease